MKTTRYFEEQVIRKRPYIVRAWCAAALVAPLRRETQADGRIRHWIEVEDTRDGKSRMLRVVTLEDGETVHNAPLPTLPRLRGRVGRGELREGHAMKLHYYPETDSLYIELKSEPGVETREVADGLNVDLDARGEVVGFDIDHASRLDLGTLETVALPIRTMRSA